MATNNGRGVSLPPALIRPTGPAEVAATDRVDPEEVDGPAEEGRGDQRASAARRPRRRPAAPAEKASKRGLHLTDSVWDRLQYEAIRKRTTVSAVAGEVLERGLPRFKVEREA